MTNIQSMLGAESPMLRFLDRSKETHNENAFDHALNNVDLDTTPRKSEVNEETHGEKQPVSKTQPKLSKHLGSAKNDEQDIQDIQEERLDLPEESVDKSRDDVLELMRDITSFAINISIPQHVSSEKDLNTNLDDAIVSGTISALTVDTAQEVKPDILMPGQSVSSTDQLKTYAALQDIVIPNQRLAENPQNSDAVKATIVQNPLEQSISDHVMKEVPIISTTFKQESLELKHSSNEIETLTDQHTPIVMSEGQSDTDTLSDESQEQNFTNKAQGLEGQNPATFSVDDSKSIIKDIAETKESKAIYQTHQAILDAKENLASNQTKTLTIALNPEELGAVHIELTADGSGKMQAMLSLEKKETLALFQQDLHQLKAILKDIGIEEAGVNLQLASDSDKGQRQDPEYIAWEDRERLLMQQRTSEAEANLHIEKITYPSSHRNVRRLDVRA